MGRLDETRSTETPPLPSGYGPLGEQVRVPVPGNRSQRLRHGAVNVRTGAVSLGITTGWTKGTHQGFLAVVRAHWRGWDVVPVEGRAGQHTSPERLEWAEGVRLEVRRPPEAAPEWTAMGPVGRHTRRGARGDRETVTVDESALAACRPLIDLSPRDRRRQAGVLSGNCWLTRERACAKTSVHLLRFPQSPAREPDRTASAFRL